MEGKKIRIIPRLDVKGPNVVKGIHFEGLRVVGTPLDLATKYYKEGADEILYMDIVASLYQRTFDYDLLKATVRKIFIPVTAGGGVRSIGDVGNALRAGADKVAINTFAISYPDLLKEAAEKFGSQCIVLSVEAKRKGAGLWEAYTDGGREKSGVDVLEWIKRALELGAGEVIISSIDQEGTKKGFDLELLRKVGQIASVPVIIHGGAGTLESIKEAVDACQPDGLAAASIFHYNNFTIGELKQELTKRNLNVRLGP